MAYYSKLTAAQCIIIGPVCEWVGVFVGLLPRQLEIACINPHQTVLCSMVDFTFKDDGGGDDNWSYKTCKAPVKSSPPTNRHPASNRPDALPVAQPAVSEH